MVYAVALHVGSVVVEMQGIYPGGVHGQLQQGRWLLTGRGVHGAEAGGRMEHEQRIELLMQTAGQLRIVQTAGEELPVRITRRR